MAEAAAAFAAFRACLDKVSAYGATARDKHMLKNIVTVISDSYRLRRQAGRDAVLAKVEEVRSEIVAHRGRLRALVDASVDEGRLHEMKAGFEDAGARSVRWSESRGEGGELIGYVMEGQR